MSGCKDDLEQRRESGFSAFHKIVMADQKLLKSVQKGRGHFEDLRLLYDNNTLKQRVNKAEPCVWTNSNIGEVAGPF